VNDRGSSAARSSRHGTEQRPSPSDTTFCRTPVVGSSKNRSSPPSLAFAAEPLSGSNWAPSELSSSGEVDWSKAVSRTGGGPRPGPPGQEAQRGQENGQGHDRRPQRPAAAGGGSRLQQDCQRAFFLRRWRWHGAGPDGGGERTLDTLAIRPGGGNALTGRPGR